MQPIGRSLEYLEYGIDWVEGLCLLCITLRPQAHLQNTSNMALPPFLSQSSDEQIVAWYQKSNDENLFTLLYERYYAKIYNKCSFLLKYHALQPEDAAQEVLIKVHHNLHKYNHSAKFSTWVFSITRNYCIDRLRKKGRQPTQISIEDDSCQQLRDDYEDPFSREADRLERQWEELNVVMTQDLRDGEAAILRMKYYEGLTARDISALIDKTESAVKMRIKRAKRKVVSKHAARFQD